MWGVWGTVATFALGTYISFSEEYRHKKDEHRTFKCNLAWKLWTYLFMQSLMLELVIAPFFWALLWPILMSDLDNEDMKAMRGWSTFKIEMIVDHGLPLICLLVDYCFNAVPIVKRHLIPLLLVGAIYMLINIIATVIAGTGIYPVLQWNDWLSLFIITVVFSSVTIVFYLLYWFNQFKLRVFAKKR